MTITESHKTKQQVDEDIVRLRHWLDKQPHLPKDVGEPEMEAFIRGTKSLEIAKKKLDAYYTFRTRMPVLLDSKLRDAADPAFKEASKALKLYFLTKPTPEGYRVMVMSLGEDFSCFNGQQKTIRCIMMVEMAMLTWPDLEGIIFIGDFKDVPGSIKGKISPAQIAMAFHWFGKCLPMRMKRSIGINTSRIPELLINTIVKPLLSVKLANRVTATSEGIEALKEIIPLDMLPSDYGGKDKSSEQLNAYWLKELEAKRDWYMMSSIQRSDEAKRPSDSDNTYGIEGTFRSLSVD